MKLSSKWIQHLPDDYTGCFKSEIKAEADCACGITERHIHCSGCGYIVSIGDWDAQPISKFKLRLK